MRPIATPRLTLRPVALDDAPALVAYRSRPEVNEYLPDRTYDLAWARSLAEEMRDREPGTPGTWSQLVVERDGVVIGDLGLRTEGSAFQPRTYEVGFTFAPEHQGQGLATEAVRGLLGFVFGELGGWRVIGLCDTRNARSARLMERVGMRREATHVDDWRHRDAWVSTWVYALLAREWRP